MTKDAGVRSPGCLRRGRRGQSMVEFALALPLLVLLTIGSFAIGIALERFLTVGQLVRHAGNMYARDIEFDDINSPARALIVEAGGNLRLSTAKGDCDPGVKSVVYLTQVQITPVTDPPGGFVNEGEPVMMHRTLIGCQEIGDSTIRKQGEIIAIWDPVKGEICNEAVPCSNPFDEPAAVVDVPSAITAALEPGATVFIVEVIHEPDDLLFRGFFSPKRLYTRGVF